MCEKCKDKPKNSISYLIIEDEIKWITKENLKEYSSKGYDCSRHLGHTPCDMEAHNKRILSSLFPEISDKIINILENEERYGSYC